MYRSTLAAAALALFAIAGTVSAQSTTSTTAAQHRFRRGELFEGINLTAAQKAQIDEIRAKYHPELSAARDSIKPDWAALRNARTAKDSAAIRAARQDIRSDRRERGEILKDEHDELVKVLGPEQRQKFEKNLKDWHADRRDRRTDRREIRSDTHEIRSDRKEVVADKREIASDKKEGEKGELKSDRKELKSDQKDLKKDLKDRKQDARDLRRDRKDK
jgi:Spy/CpxP family protein refolding chaperone